MSLQQRLHSHSSALPSCWIFDMPYRTRGSTNNGYLKVNALSVEYIGPGTGDAQAASVRTDHCVPRAVTEYNFQIKVVSSGRNGYIGVGFAGPNVNLCRLPGWEPNSYGYHGDDGIVFHGNGKGNKYGPTFGTGDIIGVSYNQAMKTISYSKNGLDLGIAFRNVCEEELYPTVGLRSPGEEIVAKFEGNDVHEG